MRVRHSLLLGLTILSACDSAVRESHPVPSFAKGGAGPTVASTDPAWGKRGDIGLSVRILGSGFDAGSRASWERNGAVDPRITVRSSSFVSSTELVAVIEIASDADLALYDVAVTTSGGRKGIGTEKFEVTTANLLPQLSGPGNNSLAWGINDAGQVVGRSNSRAFFWDPVNGIDDLGTGQAFEVDAAGGAVVGTSSVGTPRYPMLWTGGPGAWSGSQLPTTCVAGSVEGGTARAITPDGLVAGGGLTVTAPRNKTQNRPVLWNLGLGGCTQLSMPAGYSTSGNVGDLSTTGTAIGSTSDGNVLRAVVWNAGGTPTILPPASGDGSSLGHGISDDGSIAVGVSGSRPAYWLWNGSSWSAANILSIGSICGGNSPGWASAVNDFGVIVGKGCDGTARYWLLSGGVAGVGVRLSGLGSQGSGDAQAVNGKTVAGQPWIAGGSSDRAVFWNKP